MEPIRKMCDYSHLPEDVARECRPVPPDPIVEIKRHLIGSLANDLYSAAGFLRNLSLDTDRPLRLREQASLCLDSLEPHANYFMQLWSSSLKGDS